MIRIHGSEKVWPCHGRGGGGHRTQGRQQICGRPERVSHCKSVTSCVTRATFEVLVSCAVRDAPVSENDAPSGGPLYWGQRDFVL